MMETRKEKNLPPQGLRNPRGRRGGAIVPGTPPSSSNDGPTTGLKASPVAEMAIAKKKKASSTRSGLAESTRLWRSKPVVVIERWDERMRLPGPNRVATREEADKIQSSASFKLREWDVFTELDYDVMTLEESGRVYGSDSSLRSTASGTHFVTNEVWTDTWDSDCSDGRKPSPLAAIWRLDPKRAERQRRAKEATGETEKGIDPSRRTRLRGPRSVRERKEEKLAFPCEPEAGTSAPRVPEPRPAPTASKTPDRSGPLAAADEESDCSLSSAVSVGGTRRKRKWAEVGRGGVGNSGPSRTCSMESLPLDGSSQRETREGKMGKAANRASSNARLALAKNGMGGRTAAIEENRWLRESNAQLRAEMATLRLELAEMRGRLGDGRESADTPPPSPREQNRPRPTAFQRRQVTDEEEPQFKRPVAPAPRSKRSGVGAEKSVPTEGTESLEDRLFRRLGALIEAQIMALREELRSGALIGPSPRDRVSTPDPPASAPDRGGRRRRSRRRMVAAASAESDSAPPSPKRVPPTPPPRGEWAKVVGRRERRAAKLAAQPAPMATEPPRGKRGKGGKGRGSRLPRPPRTSAITLTVPEGGDMTYASAMTEARQHIKLPDLGIAEMRCRRAVTGGLILEIPGPEGREKADRLAEAMNSLLGPKGVRVARPSKRVDLRLRGLDDSATTEEVAAAIADVGKCRGEEVRVGVIRRLPSGTGTVWAQCPLSAARLAAEAGKVRVGWVEALVDTLAARPLLCYRCLEVGHVRQRCTSAVDRSNRCYRCGDASHRAAQCSTAPKCPLCADIGRPAEHRLGSRQCSSATPRKGQKVGGAPGPPAEGVSGGRQPQTQRQTRGRMKASREEAMDTQ